MNKKNILSLRTTTLILSTLLSVSMVGCSSDGGERPEYMDAGTLNGLQIPPKLSIPDTRGSLKLPEPSASTSQHGQHDEHGEVEKTQVIAPIFKGYQLKNDSQLYWLEIDQPVADVWASLPEFLSSEGIKLTRIEKLLGFIDTNWMEEYQISYNAESTSSWLSGFSPDYKDRFRIRLEAVPGEAKTRMFVAHRGLEISVANDVTEWVQRDSEAFLEREILYRYVLFKGISEAGSTELLSAYNRYQPRVKRLTNVAADIETSGNIDSVWLLIKTAVDRLGADIMKHDDTARVLTVRVGTLNLQASTQPQEDESGWFGSLFSGKDIVVDEDDSYDSGEYQTQVKDIAPEDRITLLVKLIANNESDKINIKIINEDGSDITDDQAVLFKESLLKQLK